MSFRTIATALAAVVLSTVLARDSGGPHEL